MEGSVRTGTDDELFGLGERKLGLDFIAYVADRDPAVAYAAATQGSRHPEHDHFLKTLRGCRDLLSLEERDLFLRIEEYLPAEKTSFGNVLRRDLGGARLAAPHTDDPLLKPLLYLARDLLPVLLLPREARPLLDIPTSPWARPEDPIVTLVARTEHPMGDKFITRLDSDDLGRTFGPSSAASFSFGSEVWVAVGRAQLAGILVGTAAQYTRATSGGLTQEGFLAEIGHCLELLREVVAEGRARIPVAVAFRGAHSSPDLSIELPWGTLRPPKALDVPHSTEDGGPSVILITTVEDEVIVSDVSRMGVASGASVRASRRAMARRFEQTISERVHKTALTVLLGVDEQPRVGLVHHSTLIMTPFFGSSGLSQQTGPTQTVFGVQRAIGNLQGLHMKQGAELRRWANVVEAHYSPKLDVAIRRLAAALVAGRDPSDGLIDAVIAWESLFAVGSQSELAFRIAASMARLLESSAASRGALHSEINTLYGVRSKVVHGVAPSDPGQYRAERDRAIELGVQAVAALFEKRPDLIPNEDRSRDLILGGSSERPAGPA